MHGSAGATPAVITPDAVGLDLEVASLGSRGTAYLIDAIVLFVGVSVIGVGQALLGGGGFVDGWFGIAVLFVLGMLLLFGYPIGFETMNRGRTPGKMALGLRVVTVEGAPSGFRHAAIRAMVGLFELLGSFGAIAILTSFSSARCQRLGDLAAGTLVVRERRGSRSGPQAATFAVPRGLESYVASVDVRALTPADYATIRETLQRIDLLPPPVRDELTRGLAEQLLPRIQPPPPTGVAPAAFLQAVAAAIQARRQPVRSGPSAASWTSTAPRASATAASVPPPSPSTAGSTPGPGSPDTAGATGATGATSAGDEPGPATPSPDPDPPRAIGFAPPD
jgi:uncharacterized RDD family membrane protein YckC